MVAISQSPLQILGHPLEAAKVGPVSAPGFIWLGAAALVVLTLIFGPRLWVQLGRITRRLERAKKDLEALATAPPVLLPGHGAAGEMVERTRRAMEGLEAAWTKFAQLLVRRRAEDGRDEYWAAYGAEAALSEASVLQGRVNLGFYAWFTTFLTASGLFLTFLAILIALMDVRVSPDGVVRGVEGLVQGLSGKFVSSVVALFLAIAFGFLEKWLLHRVNRGRLEVASRLDALFPRLTAVALLAEIRAEGVEQANAFRSFNADLSTRLKQSFSESLGPTLVRMVEGVEKLAEHVRAAEAAQTEAMRSPLEAAMRDLGDRISASLQQITSDFTRALSGSANAQINDLGSAVRESSRLLGDVAGTLGGAQVGFAEMARTAQDAARAQAEGGKRQIEAMSTAVAELTAQFRNAAAELGAHLAQSAQAGAERAAAAVDTAVQRADEWSTKNAKLLQDLLEREADGAQSVKRVEEGLIAGVELLNDSVEKYRSLNAGLGITADRVAATAASATHALRTIETGQAALAELSGRASGHVADLAAAGERQQELWAGISRQMEQYRAMFAEVEGLASKVLDEIQRAAEANAAAAHERFGQAIQGFDEHFGQAIQRLGGTVEELGDVLDDLKDKAAAAAGGSHGGR